MDDGGGVSGDMRERVVDSLPDAYSYPAIVADCYEGGMWVLNFPDLSGCWCEASTREEAVSLGRRTLGRYLADRERMGFPLPPPGDPCEFAQTGLGSVIIVHVTMDDFRSP